MDRDTAIKKLFMLKEVYNLDISDSLNELNNFDGVPESVVTFINTHDYSIDTFFNYLKEKQFYKSITKSKNDYEQLKGLSSFLTHAIIEIEKYPGRKKLITESLKLESVIDSLYLYFIKDDIKEAKNIIKEIKLLLEEGDN